MPKIKMRKKIWGNIVWITIILLNTNRTDTRLVSMLFLNMLSQTIPVHVSVLTICALECLCVYFWFCLNQLLRDHISFYLLLQVIIVQRAFFFVLIQIFYFDFLVANAFWFLRIHFLDKLSILFIIICFEWLCTLRTFEIIVFF